MTCWRRLKLPSGGAASSSTLVAFRQKNGARWSTAAAYLRPALDRPNLTVITGATTTKIRLEGRRAVGVNYIRHGQLEQAAGEYEVILCGGTANSPHLLLLSGIAPADELRSSGVDVIHDLPGVGKNLQDHLGAYMCWEINQPFRDQLAETTQPGLLAQDMAGRSTECSATAARNRCAKKRPPLPCYW